MAFNLEKVVNIYAVYEIIKVTNISKHNSNDNYPTLENALFRGVNLTKNADIDKYKYSGYGIRFDIRSSLSYLSDELGSNIIFFGVDMSSWTKIDNRKKYILNLGKGPTQELKHKLTAEKMYSINFSKDRTKYCLSLHYDGANSYLFVMIKKFINSKQKILKF